VTPAEWTAILIALISAGLLKYAVDAVKAFRLSRRAKTPEARGSQAIATVDQSLAVVAKARDELEADNARLRAQQAESDARHASERAEWVTERAALRSEIADLERRLREILTEVQSLRMRANGPSTGPQRAVRP